MCRPLVSFRAPLSTSAKASLVCSRADGWTRRCGSWIQITRARPDYRKRCGESRKRVATHSDPVLASRITVAYQHLTRSCWWVRNGEASILSRVRMSICLPTFRLTNSEAEWHRGALIHYRQVGQAAARCKFPPSFRKNNHLLRHL
jgi:hypothetical protein